MRRRGIVWIAPTDSVPIGCMADPATSTFWASWQHHDDGLIDDADVVGAEAAITWGRERAQVIRIRLGNTDETYFSVRPSSGELVVKTGVQLGAGFAGGRFYRQPEPSSIDH